MCTDETRIGQGKVKVEETNRQIALFALVLILTGWVAAPRINGFIQKSELIAKSDPNGTRIRRLSGEFGCIISSPNRRY